MLSHLFGKVVAVTGGNAGDEGKGKIISIVAPKMGAKYVVRYQGGANAGHTLKVGDKVFKAHLLPSGVVCPGVMNVIGHGVALNLNSLEKELRELEQAGFPPAQLQISERAQLVLPWHTLLDGLEEQRLGNAAFGSTKQGIAPFYSQVAAKTGIQVSELASDNLAERLAFSALQPNFLLEHRYDHAPLDVAELTAHLKAQWQRIQHYVCDTNPVLWDAHDRGEGILLEGQLGIARDLINGQHPYVTSSPTSAGYASVGAGVTPEKSIVVIKAYSSMVGTGCLPTGIENPDLAQKLRLIGGLNGEFGATTGRARDLGWLDLPAARYACRLNNASDIALTCLDVFGELGLETIPVCVGYRCNEHHNTYYPGPRDIESATPIYEFLPGWDCSKEKMRSCRSFDELPVQARTYVRFIEKELGVRVSIVSVGPGHDETLFPPAVRNSRELVEL